MVLPDQLEERERWEPLDRRERVVLLEQLEERDLPEEWVRRESLQIQVVQVEPEERDLLDSLDSEEIQEWMD